MEVDGPDGIFYLITDTQGYYVGAVGQRVNINGSPVVIMFDTPIIPTGNPPTIDCGEVYRDYIKPRLP